ncbi:MAG: hypothetical protein IH963_13725 [Chloroflexi bacterium]|nr:hypothetical protein [Chloroflexota bacterium]MCH8801956.1 hypothetical protein [Chloroflexota bacterium]
METLVETSKSVPVSGNILIDRKKVMELVDQLRLTIPEEIRSAEDVLSQKDQIMNIAQTDARRTKSMAEDELRERLNQSEVVTQAEARAAETIRDAEERITRMLQQSEAEALSRRTEADAYALRSLRAMESELGKLMGSVRKGIEVLAIEASSNLNSRRYEEEEAHAGMLR